MTAGPRVLLIGMMGAGKSTVGRALAARSGWPHLDNDELVERMIERIGLAGVGIEAALPPVERAGGDESRARLRAPQENSSASSRVPARSRSSVTSRKYSAGTEK